MDVDQHLHNLDEVSRLASVRHNNELFRTLEQSLNGDTYGNTLDQSPRIDHQDKDNDHRKPQATILSITDGREYTAAVTMAQLAGPTVSKAANLPSLSPPYIPPAVRARQSSWQPALRNPPTTWMPHDKPHHIQSGAVMVHSSNVATPTVTHPSFVQGRADEQVYDPQVYLYTGSSQPSARDTRDIVVRLRLTG